MAGSGRVATLSGDGYAETPIRAGSFVWFTPGTIHRLLNDGGDLEIVVLMQNAGLPEAGDMVITFDDAVLADPAAYAAAAALPEATTASDPDPARARRDRGVEGFVDLLAGGPDALGRFHARAAALVRPHVGAWRSTWEAGPLAAAEATGAQLDALARGDETHLGGSSVHALPPPPDERRWGCCGTLGTYLPAVRLRSASGASTHDPNRMPKADLRSRSQCDGQARERADTYAPAAWHTRTRTSTTSLR